jgi:3-isopropylmalate dehydrogenase
MKRIEIPIVAGDGVGPELMAEALLLLGALQTKIGIEIATVPAPLGGNCYREKGVALPDESLALIKGHPATLVSIISTKQCPSPSPMGLLRKELEFHADIRRVVPQASSKEPIDIVFYRECSEDFLPDRNMFLGMGEFMPTPDIALSLRVTTRGKCARIAGEAFEYARRHGRKKITVAHKSTVFRMNCGMFWEEAQKAAREFPDIACEGEAPDSLAGRIVMNPGDLDVILAANLFGDILADVGAAKAGNLMSVMNTNGTNALFYPSHGEMGRFAGTGRINPLPMFHSAANLLKWLALDEAAAIFEAALAETSKDMPLDSLILPEGVSARDVTLHATRILCRG